MIKKSISILACFLFGFLTLSIFIGPTVTATNDPYFKNQWYLSRIGFNHVWSNNFVGREVVVAVIDSGINIDNPDLKDNIWRNRFEIAGNGVDNDQNGFIDDINGWDFVNNTPDPRPKVEPGSSDGGLNHGTMISGIIGAGVNNNLGISGIAKNVKIMPLKALNERGEGRVGDVIRAIDYAINNGADIINLSFTGPTYNEGFKEAIERAYRAGVLVVAAAGNNSDDLTTSPLYPACFKGSKNENIIVAVSATDTLDQKAYFSSYSSACVDISAPGISFFSTYFYDLEDEKYKDYEGYWSGTSMSAAVVTGALALIKEANPKLSNREVLDVLLRSADNIDALNPDYVGQLGSGRVNILNSVNWALEKWENISGRFLLFPQSGIADFKRGEILEEDEGSVFNTVRLLKSKGVEDDRFFAFSPNFNGSVNISTGDLNNNGRQEIIFGAGVGGGPQVRIFDSNFNVLGQFFAYEQRFRGGVNVALGDVDGNGQVDIITAPGPGGGPHIRIFDNKGNLKGQFFAYDSNFSGGVSLAVGDLNGDGRAEIITAPLSRGGPHVKIFSGTGQLIGQFFAYENDFFGGVQVSLGDVYGKNSKGRNDIITAPGPGRSPEIRIFDISGSRMRSFLAYADKFKGGVNLTVGDLNKNGLDEIIVGAGPGGTPHIRAFNGRGELMESFYGLEEDFTGGVVVGFLELNN